jgi:phosphoserine aminotransferase
VEAVERRGLRALRANETIGGLEFDWVPEAGDVPLVADMSSDILSRPIDVSRFGMIYAGAQKNIGPSGIVVVIVREDLLGRARSLCPTMLDYKVAADNGSMYNTRQLSWYLSGLVFEWLKEQGGVEAMEQAQRSEAAHAVRLHRRQRFYSNPISKSPFVDERAVPPGRRPSGQAVPGRRRRAWPAEPQGPPLGGRHARLHLQRRGLNASSAGGYMAEFEKEHGYV